MKTNIWRDLTFFFVFLKSVEGISREVRGNRAVPNDCHFHGVSDGLFVTVFRGHLDPFGRGSFPFADHASSPGPAVFSPQIFQGGSSSRSRRRGVRGSPVNCFQRVI